MAKFYRRWPSAGNARARQRRMRRYQVHLIGFAAPGLRYLSGTRLPTYKKIKEDAIRFGHIVSAGLADSACVAGSGS